MDKQDTSQSDTNSNVQSSAGSGFGKVLGSIRGLRQRLGEFSLDEVSDAEANLRSLAKQLIVIRDNLDDLAQLKQAVIDTDRRINGIPELNFDLVSLDSLEKHPQLHAIVQASKLIRFHRLMKAARASADAMLFDTENNKLRVAESVAAHEVPVYSRHESVASIEEPEIASERNSTENDPQATPSDLTTIDTMVSLATTPPEPNGTLSALREERSLAASTEENFLVQIDQDGNRPTDWTFDLGEASPTVGETSNAAIEFVFPDETFSDQKPSPMDSSTIYLPPPSVAAVEAPASMAASSPEPNESGAPVVSKDNSEIKTSGAPATVKIDGSEARSPNESDIDQRLLDELIKNYGDFTATNSLPPTSDASEPAEPQYDNPAVETSLQFDEPIALERQLSKVRRAGDLDRQLKKIIKDYGENDLYPRQSLVNLKTGGIAAFAVLGLVLAALYLFKAPDAGKPTQARPPARSAEAQKAASTQAAGPNTNTSGDSKDRLDGPEAAKASTDPITGSKQNHEGRLGQ